RCDRRPAGKGPHPHHDLGPPPCPPPQAGEGIARNELGRARVDLTATWPVIETCSKPSNHGSVKSTSGNWTPRATGPASRSSSTFASKTRWSRASFPALSIFLAAISSHGSSSTYPTLEPRWWLTVPEG